MKQTEILLTIKLHQELFIDPKRVRLLKEIKECGSINQAAKNAKVSYKSAWDHLEAMNKISPKPLLERNIGAEKWGRYIINDLRRTFATALRFARTNTRARVPYSTR